MMLKITPSFDAAGDAAQTLTEACHGAAYNAGWWHDPKTGNPMPDTNEAFGLRLALIHSEVSEALEGRRKNKPDDHLIGFRNDEVELADAIIRIFDLAGGLNLRVAEAIAMKLAFNATRGDHQREARIAAGGKAF